MLALLALVCMYLPLKPHDCDSAFPSFMFGHEQVVLVDLAVVCVYLLMKSHGRK
jgi:hypothetical protein